VGCRLNLLNNLLESRSIVEDALLVVCRQSFICCTEGWLNIALDDKIEMPMLHNGVEIFWDVL
jgi:hypothetical protein